MRWERLEEVNRLLEDPDLWNDPERAQKLGKERAELEIIVDTILNLTSKLEDAHGLLELANEENDADTADSVKKDLDHLESELQGLEFRRMFAGEMDVANAFLDVQAGSGGTEAQDWAEMLLRMYLRWGERRGFRTELIEASAGEVAGIKSATVRFEGDHAYGWLRTETGVHRLVRKSPFDSGNRRHTSFAAVFVSPEVDEDIDIEINPADLRIDVYRASGAGGQHVNRTDSAVRMVHIPTGITVVSAEKSQHQNRKLAMMVLRSRLYEQEATKLADERAEARKGQIGSGDRSQRIRTYNFPQGRVSDHRINLTLHKLSEVIAGDGLDEIIEALISHHQAEQLAALHDQAGA